MPHFESAARIAVAHIDEELIFLLDYFLGPNYSSEDLNNYKLQRGLIPAPECKHEHLIDIPRGKNGGRYGPRCKDCGVFVQC